jgi:hypothetical protein
MACLDVTASVNVDLDIMVYKPGTSTAMGPWVNNIVASDGAGSWFACGVAHPQGGNVGAQFDTQDVAIPTGTAIFRVDIPSGIVSGTVWVRWIGDAKR